MFEIKVNRDNDHEMFDFLKNHYTYHTVDSRNSSKSIANCVKVYKLGLSGDCWRALSKVQQDDYTEIDSLIQDWECENDYQVRFNGNSAGYLVLYNPNSRSGSWNFDSVLPDFITDNDTYEEYENWCNEHQISAEDHRHDLRKYVDLVCSFDRLCDELRDVMEEYSNCDLVGETLEQIVTNFNYKFSNEIRDLHLNTLEVSSSNKVYIAPIVKYNALMMGLESVVNSCISKTTLKMKIDNYYLWIEE